jgi:hypothetical protein
VRRAEALNPAALLIDQDRGIRLANGIPKLLNKPKDLIGCFNIPLE